MLFIFFAGISKVLFHLIVFLYEDYWIYYAICNIELYYRDSGILVNFYVLL